MTQFIIKHDNMYIRKRGSHEWNETQLLMAAKREDGNGNLALVWQIEGKIYAKPTTDEPAIRL